VCVCVGGGVMGCYVGAHRRTGSVLDCAVGRGTSAAGCVVVQQAAGAG
jgi:hypothetical protein